LKRLRDSSNWYRTHICTSVDIGVNANLELVDKFCYLGDMLSVDGDVDAAVGKFRHLVPLLTNKDISLNVRGRLYIVQRLCAK